MLLLSKRYTLETLFIVFVFVLCTTHAFVCVVVGEFDPGSGRTLAACLTHASRTERPATVVVGTRVANG